MATSRPTGRQLVLLCKCVHYEVIPQATKQETIRLLSNGGVEVRVIEDLCGLAADRDPRMQEWAQMSSLAIVACFPRAVRWLFNAAGAPLQGRQVSLFNMRTRSADEIARGLLHEERSGPSDSNHQLPIINHQSGWVPWFPVIDYDRCINCKQCLNFCLFGVYGLSSDGRVEVQKPSGCKTNCPACARMCPRQAIIFPKYADPPINGDEGPVPAAAERTAVAGDVYERIRSRSAGGKRFSAQTGDSSQTRSCPKLDSLRRELSIPDDVLASLSPAEIQRAIAQSKTGSHAETEKKGDESHE